MFSVHFPSVPLSQFGSPVAQAELKLQQGDIETSLNVNCHFSANDNLDAQGSGLPLMWCCLLGILNLFLQACQAMSCRAQGSMRGIDQALPRQTPSAAPGAGPRSLGKASRRVGAEICRRPKTSHK